VPKACNCILDVGCGTGELTKRLTPYSTEVIGIDVSKNMINEARKRNSDDKINYINISVEKYLEEEVFRSIPRQQLCANWSEVMLYEGRSSLQKRKSVYR
jgi:predicted TPR repeat methyltransferase